MPYPILSLQDVDPRSNENSYTNDPVIMKQALAAREAKRKYYEDQIKRIDKWMENAETATALTSLGTTGATLIAPNPVTGAIALSSNLAGAGIDLYQGIRSALNGEWGDAAKNAGELFLSLIGAKAMNSANKLYKIDKALDATKATRTTITKTIGRGGGRHKITIPVERDKANAMSALGFSASIGGNASSVGGNLGTTNRRYIAPADNTRMVNIRPITLTRISPKSK